MNGKPYDFFFCMYKHYVMSTSVKTSKFYFLAGLLACCFTRTIRITPIWHRTPELLTSAYNLVFICHLLPVFLSPATTWCCSFILHIRWVPGDAPLCSYLVSLNILAPHFCIVCMHRSLLIWPSVTRGLLVSLSELLCVVLQWTQKCSCLFDKPILFPLGVYPRVGFLNHMRVLILIFEENTSDIQNAWANLLSHQHCAIFPFLIVMDKEAQMTSFFLLCLLALNYSPGREMRYPWAGSGMCRF